jgi:hypothetical protein
VYPQKRHANPERTRVTLLRGALLGAIALVALQLLLVGQYWDYSEGVYLATSRLFLHGAGLYDQVVAAQSPPLFVAGAAIVGVHDALWFVRLVLGIVELGSALLAALLVWRLCASRAAAALTLPLFLLMPWTVHEHAALIPEVLAPPLLLGGVLLRDTRWAGPIAGLLAFVKAPFVLPAAALVFVARDRRRTALTGVATLGVLGLGSLAIFGTHMWTDVVRAQLQTGHPAFGDLAGEWAQAGWNDVGLLVAAALAWRFRSALDRPLLNAQLVVAGATALTFLTTWKLGTSLTVLVPIEAMLVPLAVAGATAAIRRPERAWAVVGCVALAFPLVQSIALVAKPEIDGQHPFLRPGSSPAYGVTLTEAEVDRAAAAARRCPDAVPYSGPPFIAYIAHRPMPAGQPDQFLTGHAAILAGVRRKIEAAQSRCP